MSEIKNQDRILEAIDQLRRRKARPDSQRICNFLLRRFCVESKDTEEDLKRLVDAKTVIKVEYKGSISYRNAAKWARYNKVKSNNDFTNIICGALSELIVHEPDYLDFGVPPNELAKYTIEKNKEVFSKRNLNALIKRELKSGNLVKLENGNYSLVEDQQQPSTPPLPSVPPPDLPNPLASCDYVGEMVSTSRSPSSASSNQDTAKKEKQANKMAVARSVKTRKSKANNLENESSVGSQSPDSMQKDLDDTENATGGLTSGGFRPGMRRKRAAKKVFDPSDNNLPKKKRGRPFGSKNKDTRETKEEEEDDVDQDILITPKLFCYICHQQGSNRQGQQDNLISCRDCTNKAHPKCTERDVEGERSLPWQCFHCKTCCICSETDEYETMVICRACDDAYHLSCHAPSISNKFKGPFLCSRCSKSKVKLEVKQEPMPMDSVSRSTPSPPSSTSSSSLASPLPNSSSGVSSLTDEVASEEDIVPDASPWTVAQVGSYLRQRGYHLQAGVFEQHEIDGQALLLLKRSDVLTGLAMKLGPALKAYKQVKRLQIRSSDPNLLWA